MDFWDKLKNDVVDAGNTIGKKARETSETVRLNNVIRSQEKEIERALMKLGQSMYDAHPEECEAQCPELVEKIRIAQKEIRTSKDALAELKRDEHCPHCGKPLSRDAKFCVYCGQPVNVEEQDPNELITCFSCGKKVKAENAFCIYCGAPLEVPHED